LLLGGVKVTALAMGQAPEDALFGWLELMVAFDAVVVVLSPWLFGRAIL
jgi:hypothetical protein